MRLRWFPVTALALSSGLSFPPTLAVDPPAQPDSGPGGRDYTHRRARVTRVFSPSMRYRVYEPAAPRPRSAPVLLYLGGIAGAGPYLGAAEFNLFGRAYDRMFRHIARRGYVVIFPAYGPVGTRPAQYEARAAAATRHALRSLERGGRVSPEPGQFAVAGHSFGGLLALSLAARPEAHGLPRPRVIVTHEPSLRTQLDRPCPADPAHPFCDVTFGDPAAIAPDTIHVTVVGGQQRMHEIEATLVQSDVAQIDDALENLLFIHDDDRGTERLRATHLSPGADPLLPLDGFELNAIDWYGYWKPTDAALDAAFRSEHAEFVLGNGQAARSMGAWADGTPVRPMSTRDDWR